MGKSQVFMIGVIIAIQIICAVHSEYKHRKWRNQEMTMMEERNIQYEKERVARKKEWEDTIKERRK